MSVKNTDKGLAKFLIILLFLPLTLAYFSGDKFRYPCQDPSNWDSDMCKLPRCDVTRTCPEHIFKGGRDPRLGPPTDREIIKPTQTPPALSKPIVGANCK